MIYLNKIYKILPYDLLALIFLFLFYAIFKIIVPLFLKFHKFKWSWLLRHFIKTYFFNNILKIEDNNSTHKIVYNIAKIIAISKKTFFIEPRSIIIVGWNM